MESTLTALDMIKSRMLKNSVSTIKIRRRTVEIPETSHIHITSERFQNEVRKTQIKRIKCFRLHQAGEIY